MLEEHVIFGYTTLSFFFSKVEDDEPVDDGSGNLEIWRVEDFKLAPWPEVIKWKIKYWQEDTPSTGGLASKYIANIYNDCLGPILNRNMLRGLLRCVLKTRNLLRVDSAENIGQFTPKYQHKEC